MVIQLLLGKDVSMVKQHIIEQHIVKWLNCLTKELLIQGCLENPSSFFLPRWKAYEKKMVVQK
jgi:hypothetical protein